MAHSNYLFGKTSIIEAIKNGVEVTSIMAIAIDPKIRNLNSKIQWEIVPNKFFRQFGEVNHQNIVAMIAQPITHWTINELIENLANKPKSLVLMLDSIEDPRNFGAILRTAAAFEVDAIIYKNVNQASINDLVIKTSMGGVYQLKFVKVSNLTLTLELLKTHHWWTYATNLANNAIEYNRCEFDAKSILIVGNENHGITPLLAKNADFNLKISTNASIQSLNVSVATGIILSYYYLNK